jgi:folate-dependent phosphoribosylglycinamide formyltransferase PurN
MVSETETRMEAALMQRDAAMMLLIAQAQGLVQQLALPAESEKAAVAGLVAVGQAMVSYARAAQPDPEVMAGFDRILAALSPALAGRIAGPCPLQDCLDESGAYAGGRLFARRQGGRAVRA